MNIQNVLFGSDVEYFLRNKKTKEIISAEDLIKGTKYEPFKFDPDNMFFATSLDNVLAEGNIPPAKSSMDFIASLGKLRSYIDSVVPADVETVAIASARLDEKWLQTENARVFGCDPSINCWTGDVVQPIPTGDNLRSAGFHIHVGYDDHDEETNVALAKAMDLFLGVPSVLIEPASERKAVGYGQAGNFRHQPHGVEYRVLSSYFASEPKLIEWAFNNANLAVEALNVGQLARIEAHRDAIIDSINTNDQELAQELVKEFSIPV